MAPKKGPFFFYMTDFKDRERRRGNNIPWEQVANAASPSWKNMTPREKEVYEKKAKEWNEDNKGKPNAPKKKREKYSSQGVPLSLIEKEKQEKEEKRNYMKSRIKQIVEDAFLDNEIATKPFYFIMANYFVKTDDGIFVPAELAVMKFNFTDGIMNKYHTYLNPGALPMGYAYLAQEHSNQTHRLPCPSKAMGETDFESVYFRVKEFISSSTTSNEVPTVFTKESEVPMIVSVMENLSETFTDREFDIFPLEELFFALKEETGKYGITGESDVKNIHVAKRLLDIDPYENRPEIACQFHIEQDATKYCALSYGMRWAYMFADHICKEINIELVPGKNLPHNADVSFTDVKEEQNFEEVEQSFHTNDDNTTDDRSEAASGDGWLNQWSKSRKQKQRLPSASSFSAVPRRTERWGQNSGNAENTWS